jgi:hypothetical protein
MRTSINFDQLVELATRPKGIVMAGMLNGDNLAFLENFVLALSDSVWQLGDESDHAWEEYHVPSDRLPQILSCLPDFEELWTRSSARVAWINRFRQSQWIGSHKDASGDLQLIIGIKIPTLNSGGQLWLANQSQLVPFGTGDAFLFNAASIVHGTTAPLHVQAERLTLNVRLWFN